MTRLQSLRAKLLRWYDRHQRALPWRHTRDPYAIWISEVMLQQTQVRTVIPYWERFLARFPTVHDLAEAGLPEVLAFWSGLGYYSRARSLHRASKTVVAKHRGELPATAERLRGLPGFGRYTAGAVASIAFDEATAAVDGNAGRVLSRLFLLDGASGDKLREQKLWQLAGRLVRGERPGDLNQALMELGATVCRWQDPSCLLCPVRGGCAALRAGKVAQIPSPRPRRPRTTIRLAVAAWRRKGSYLLARRREKGLFGGLWELPCTEIGAGSSLGQIEMALRELLGPSIRIGGTVGTVNRSLTHRELELNVFRIRGSSLPSTLRQYQEIRWVDPKATAKIGISSAMAKVLMLCEGGPRPLSRTLLQKRPGNSIGARKPARLPGI